MKKITNSEKEILENLLQENKLNYDSVLYRYTSEKHLEKDKNNNYFLIAKTEPIDMVVDIYNGDYHVFIAKDIGSGISFLTKQEQEYQNQERFCVAVTLRDIIEQGGLVYTVSSLPVYLKAFFLTLPEGKIKVKLI